MNHRSERSWRDLAQRQHGVIHREQLTAEGFSAHAIRTRVARGELVDYLPNTFRVGGTPDTWHSRLKAAELWGGDCFVSHRSAAALWELDGFDHQRPVEISTYTAKRHPSVITHRLDQDDRPALRNLGGFRLSVPERTILDLAGISTPTVVALALEDALRRKLTTLDRMWDGWELDGGHGRKGTACLRRLLAERDDRWEKLRSRLEAKMMRILTRVDSTGLEVDFPVIDAASHYRLDFAFPEVRLGVETHGLKWHFGEERWKKDLKRDRHLALLGWEILYYSWDDVHQEPARVEAEVRSFLRARALSRLA